MLAPEERASNFWLSVFHFLCQKFQDRYIKNVTVEQKKISQKYLGLENKFKTERWKQENILEMSNPDQTKADVPSAAEERGAKRLSWLSLPLSKWQGNLNCVAKYVSFLLHKSSYILRFLSRRREIGVKQARLSPSSFVK